MSLIFRQFQIVRIVQIMSVVTGLFTQVSALSAMAFLLQSSSNARGVGDYESFILLQLQSTCAGGTGRILKCSAMLRELRRVVM